MGGQTQPIEVLRRWFDAHARGDLVSASALMGPRATVHVYDRQLTGFEQFMAWYAERKAAQGPSFRYDVVDLLGGDQHAVAIIRLSDGSRSWRQVAVYLVDKGLIVAMHGYEDAPDR